jgi:hypothetical protein
MILYEGNCVDSKSCLTISQLFSAKKETKQYIQLPKSPLPLYIGLNSSVCSKNLVEGLLHHLGISISYDRVIQLWQVHSVGSVKKMKLSVHLNCTRG